MKPTSLKQIPASQFFARLSRESLLEGFVRYLAVRIADQQQVIANMVTVDNEQRLGRTLLQLPRTMGQEGSARHSHRAEDLPRRTLRDGGHDETKDQLVYAAFSSPWADRDE